MVMWNSNNDEEEEEEEEEEESVGCLGTQRTPLGALGTYCG